MKTQHQPEFPSQSHQPTVDNVEVALRLHLATEASGGKPLCGERAPDAAIGSYAEHLDTSCEEVRWVREVFGLNGKPVKGCEACLALYRSVLL